MATTNQTIQLRAATIADAGFIRQLWPRFAESGKLPWRDHASMGPFQQRSVEKVVTQLQAPEPGHRVILATDTQGLPLGFIHLCTERSFLTSADQGYINMLAVASTAEGQGVGRALLHAAEDWARAAGYQHLALDTFGDNTHARAVYHRLGYGEESVKMVKRLD